MSWFKKKQPETITPEAVAPIIADSKQRAAIEIVANADARADVIEKANEANKHLRGLIEDNHFTVTIFIAAGGKQPKNRSAN